MTIEELKKALEEGFTNFADKLKATLKPSAAPEKGAVDIQAQVAEAVEAATAQFSEKVDALTTQLGDERKQRTEAERTAAAGSLANFREKMRGAGRWVPAFDQGGVYEFMQALDEGKGETVEFSQGEGDEKKAIKQSPLEFFQGFLEGLPKIVEFKEVTPDGQKAAATNLVEFNEPKGGQGVIGLDVAVPDEERANRPAGIGPEEWSTAFQMDIILGRHETRVAKLLTTAANFPAGSKVTLSGTDQWSSTDAASDPIEDIEVGREAIGKDPNKLILGRQVLTQLKKHSKITGRLRTTKTGIATLKDLEEIFEIQILVGRGVKRASEANSCIWGKHAVLAHINQSTNVMDLTLAKTFVWITAPGTVQGFQVQRSRAVPASRKADELDTHFCHDEKMTSGESGYLIENAVA